MLPFVVPVLLIWYNRYTNSLIYPIISRAFCFTEVPTNFCIISQCQSNNVMQYIQLHRMFSLGIQAEEKSVTIRLIYLTFWFTSICFVSENVYMSSNIPRTNDKWPVPNIYRYCRWNWVIEPNGKWSLFQRSVPFGMMPRTLSVSAITSNVIEISNVHWLHIAFTISIFHGNMQNLFLHPPDIV